MAEHTETFKQSLSLVSCTEKGLAMVIWAALKRSSRDGNGWEMPLRPARCSPTLETVHLGRTAAQLGTLKPLTAMEKYQCGWKTTCTSVFVQIRQVSQIIPSRPPVCDVDCDQNQSGCRHHQPHRQPAVAVPTTWASVARSWWRGSLRNLALQTKSTVKHPVFQSLSLRVLFVFGLCQVANVKNHFEIQFQQQRRLNWDTSVDNWLELHFKLPLNVVWICLEKMFLYLLFFCCLDLLTSVWMLCGFAKHWSDLAVWTRRLILWARVTIRATVPRVLAPSASCGRCWQGPIRLV